MDRRRFIPGPESMESRMMLSTAAAPAVATAAATTTTTVDANLPYTIQQKMTRIDRIPINMRALAPNRVLPQGMIDAIQQGMEETISSLKPASTDAIKGFNNVLRDVVSRPSLRASDAKALNNSLTQVLVSAGASTDAIDKITTNLEALATTVNTAQGLPVFLTTNDYALVLQMTLIVGQPMPAPTPPRISPSTGTQVDALHNIGKEGVAPMFTGTYQATAQMQILQDGSNEVLGEAQAGANGRYSITLNQPLGVGTYKLRIRAVDELGHVGNSSGVFILKVVPPQGQ
ncbi:Ig-like domain-containing protein [Paludisphaera mucosa]|uniref:Ig-like domain-containing protein n=1 Tax=Paludisphaera mucosa TaxID=3030827 RepID=A0ABT6FCI2_9BACT|nr:Ig-like domain-containing protein [Paludisphaera mucosa]MDG3005298.1 Ig-like domain-containing protein [Paludisphaera mucosa]